MTLVRSNKRIAGCPPPGTVGEADPDTLAALPPGSVEDMTKLSKRVPAESDLGRRNAAVTAEEVRAGMADADPKFVNKPWDVVGTAPSDES